MAENFYTLLTEIGKAKIANASVLGQKINFTRLVVGDSNGQYYEPTESQTKLAHQVWQGQVGNVKIDENNPNWIVIETVIPTDVGGFTIREAGLVDDEENLLVIAKYPQTYKPVATEGTVKDLIVNMIFEVSNTSVITLKIDPTVVLATKKDVDDLKSKCLSKSEKASDSDKLDGLDSSDFARSNHTHTKANITDFAHTHDDRYYTESEVNNLINGKANSNHTHDDRYMPIYKGDGTLANDLGVAQVLRWKNYGQGHVIFDASQGTAPNGVQVDRTNSNQPWTAANCPTLMGFNGGATWGVRVDSSRTADQVQGFPFRNNNGKLEVMIGGEWLSVGTKQYTVIRQGGLKHGQRFDYSGSSGVLRHFLPISSYTKLYIDGLEILGVFNNTEYERCFGLEFKNSISIVHSPRHYETDDTVHYLIQTEK